MEINKNTYIIKKTLFYLFVLILYFPIVLIIFFVLFEYSGAAGKILKKKYNLYEIVRGIEDTDYYDNKNFGDPYEIINNLKLHPYYFSITSKALKENEDIVKVDSEGYRVTYFKNKNSRKGIVLGGSVAFGHGATSNFSTIPSYLSKYSDINFINLAQPIWNSSQELISLLRYDESYDLSISFSLSNDIHSFCVNKKNLNIIDSPEIFNYLKNLYDNSSSNIFNKIYIKNSYASFKNNLKNMVFKFFPKTYNLLQANKRMHDIVYIPFQHTVTAKNCFNNFEEIKSNILKNQTKMYQISEARNAKHIFIIQPFLHLHKNYSFLSDENFLQNEKKLINDIIESDLCNKIKCINYSNFFDNIKKKQLVYDPGIKFCYNKCFDSSVNELFNQDTRGKSFKNNYFIDNYHLTDQGNLLIAHEIIKEIIN